MMVRNKTLINRGGLVLGLFFLSGFASLIYEVVWTRMLVLIFGATTLAVSTVLTAFMAGLALGSLIFSRVLSQRSHPLLIYAILELTIGLYGFLIPWLLPFLTPIYQVAWERFHQDFYLFSLLRFALVGFVLLLPTTLMGATLPVLSQFFSKESYRAGQYLGFLYTMNTLGAVLGTFSTGFILLPGLGVRQTILAAALINFLVAGLGLIAWKGVQTAQPTDQDRKSFSVTPPPYAIAPLISGRVAWIVLISFFISGLAAMVYEVAWSRALSLVLGSTIYAFSAMLTTFLSGLAIGSFIASLWVERSHRHLQVVGLLQIGIGISAFCTMSLMGELPYIFVALYEKLSAPAQWLPFLWFTVAFFVMFVPSFFLGMLFPFVVKLFQARISNLGQLAGDVYAANTFGAIWGSFLAGFVFIPAMGIQNSVIAMVYLNFFLGFVLILAEGRSPRAVIVIGFLVLLVFPILVKPSWNARIMSSGVFMNLPLHAETVKRTGREGFYKSLDSDGSVLFYKEGITATVTVEKESGNTVALRINGRRESGERFMRTQVLIGHIPILLSPHPDTVLVIGWGSGATVGSVIQHPVQHVKAVELEPAIIEATKYFDPVNHRPLQDPRVEVIVNDGRNYLLVTPEKFDVIISQPSLPWITGASNLFTQEFFELGASRLKEGGVFGQWITTDAIRLEDFRSVTKAFQSAFSHTWIFQTLIGDILLVGFKDHPSLDLSKIQTAFNEPNIARDLDRLHVRDPFDLLSLYVMGEESVRGFTEGVVSNTDDNAYIELFGPRHFYASDTNQVRATIGQVLFRFLANETISGKLSFLNGPEDHSTFLLKLAEACLKDERGPFALMYAEQSLKYRETAEGHYIRGKTLLSLLEYLESTNQDVASGAFSGMFKNGPQQSEKLLVESTIAFQKALRIDPTAILARFELGKLYFKRGDLNAAEEQYFAVLKQDPDSYEAHANLGAIYLQKGQLEKAQLEYQKVLPQHPQDPEVHFKLGLIYAKMARYGQAMQAYETTLSLTPSLPEAHFNLALVAELDGHPEKAVIHFQKFLELAPADTSNAAYRGVAEGQLKKLQASGAKE